MIKPNNPFSPRTLLAASIGIGFSIPFLLGGSAPLTPTVPAGSDNARFAPVYSPDVPRQTTFAEKSIVLDRYDLRERMDRELSSFCYMHSSTLLLFKRANRIFPIVEPILKEEGIPDDFKYLMTIESNLDARARSPRGACGLWQFMETTAREFGLEVNAEIDERYHTERATRAACRYFRQAYAKYGDWMSVAASYNAGMGRISSSLSRQEVTTALDLWLNEETSRYMFRILAVKTLFARPSHYGFHLRRENLYPPFEYTTDTVRGPITDLYAYAQSRGLSYAQLKDVNLWLRSDHLNNKANRTYVLQLPRPSSVRYNPARTHVHDPAWLD